jgi:hypothetical protein
MGQFTSARTKVEGSGPSKTCRRYHSERKVHATDHGPVLVGHLRLRALAFRQHGAQCSEVAQPVRIDRCLERFEKGVGNLVTRIEGTSLRLPRSYLGARLDRVHGQRHHK